jgi:DNA-directed RNA polymerase III subunit RPC4
MLTQARRREIEMQSRKEVATGLASASGRGPRKQVIRTDIEDGSRKMIIDSFMRDTSLEDDELDLGDNEEGVSLIEDVSNRCYPLKVPFSSDRTMISDTERNLVPDNELVLIQLPSLFPTMVPVQPAGESGETPKKRGGRGTSGSAAPRIPSVNRSIGTPFSDIPDGKIGTLKIHKSGKTVLEIGKTEFLVEEGQRPNFRSEVACLCPGESEIIFLGQATKRVVVSPVIT